MENQGQENEKAGSEPEQQTLATLQRRDEDGSPTHMRIITVQPGEGGERDLVEVTFKAEAVNRDRLPTDQGEIKQLLQGRMQTAAREGWRLVRRRRDQQQQGGQDRARGAPDRER